jgi:hypothetical protein
MIRNSQNGPPGCRELGVSQLVVFGALEMAGPIEFDDELQGNAREIEEVAAGGVLSPELEAANASVSQQVPEGLFVAGFASTQLSRTSGGLLFPSHGEEPEQVACQTRRVHPSPRPSPPSEERE